jgi:hypothetical protein
VKPEDDEMDTDVPIKTEPQADPATGVETAPVVVPVTMPDIEDEIHKFSTKDMAPYNTNNWWSLDGSAPSFTNTTIGPATLFEDICPDSWSARQTSYASAGAMSGGSGVFGEAAKLTGRWGWWSTNFYDSFTDEGYGTYTTKAGAKGQSPLCLAGVACHKLPGAVGGLGPFEDEQLWVKWGAEAGVLPTTPFMQFQGTSETGTPTVFNYSIGVPMRDGQVDLNLLHVAIAKSCPKNGCFFVMDLRVKKIFFQIMDGAKKTLNDVTGRDFIPDPNPKYTGYLSSWPVFPAYSVDNTAYTGAEIIRNMDISSIDRNFTWFSPIRGYDQASYETAGTGFTTLAAAQKDAPRNCVLFNQAGNGGAGTYYSFGNLLTFNASSTCKIHSPWMRVGSDSQIIGWMIQVGTKATLVTTTYGFKSVAPLAKVGGQERYRLTTSDVAAEIISVMPRPKFSVIGFTYDAFVGDYGELTWMSQI